VNEGSCSRYQFIEAIYEAANRTAEIVPSTAAEFLAKNPLPAARPAFGALRNFCASTALGITLQPWQNALGDFIAAEGLRRGQEVSP
jgi:dTDP-4-dehydrorhamnose reductase